LKEVEMAGTPRPAFDKAKSLDELRALAGAGEVREANASDEIDGVQPALVIEPADEAELAKMLSFANAAGLAVAPRGHGTKLTWGIAPSRADAVISVTRLNRVLEHANHDMTVTVEAGVTIGELERTVAQKGQRLALDPLWPEEATVGGVIATNDSGALRIRFGSVRDLIIGITIVLPDGTIAVSGGKVVKNVAGYDLPKLMTGAFGTLGVISKAVFRLHPLPDRCRTLTFSFPSTKQANDFMLAIADSMLVPTGLQMRASSDGEAAEVDVRLEGVAAGVEAQTQQLCAMVASRSIAVRQTDQDVASRQRTESRSGKGPGPANAGGAEPRATGSEWGGSTASALAQAVDVWRSRERLWRNREYALIVKLSVLPSELSSTAEYARQQCPRGASWSMVAQSVGLATLRVDLDRNATQMESQVTAFVAGLRARISGRHGTAIVLHCPPELKRQLDVWGSQGTAQALMMRVKQQFDPAGTLNPGRFVGGI
jgi:glycolate oxidase FAD binding subunit